MTSDPMDPAVDHPQIGPVSPDERDEALGLVFSRLATADGQQQVELFLAALASGEVLPESLLGAHRRQRLTGAVFTQIHPGKTAVVWPPRIVSGESPSTAAGLLEAVCDWLVGQQVSMVQALLQTDVDPDAATIRKGGFESLTDLLYLVCPEDQFPTSPPRGPVQFEAYRDENHDRLVRIVEDTYRQTCDCPSLNGVRRIEDVLIGYRSVGAFDPSRWLIVRHQGHDVGCLLLADHPEHGNWELVYMGVASQARGRGWGTDITRHAQWLTRRAGRPRLVLAVDAANDPAIDMYATAGFQSWDRRSVYVKIFHTAE